MMNCMLTDNFDTLSMRLLPMNSMQIDVFTNFSGVSTL